jgi:iron complex transport system substrate-binding protein
MIRRVHRAAQFMLVALACTLTAACDRATPGPQSPQKKSPTVASLVPAATDLIVGMGAADHLVAVSNYNRGPETADLPRVGDYQTVDWEKLTVLRPDVLISFYGPGHTPAGFLEKIDDLHIAQLNVKLDRLDEIYDGITKLGQACNEPAKAAALRDRLKSAIDAIRNRYKDQPPVTALIVRSVNGQDLAGTETFFDDILETAGGKNVITASPWPTLDREALAALRPEVILQLLPGRDPQSVAEARAAWKSLPQIPAVKNNRIFIFTEDYIMQPGPHLPQVAQKFAAALHPASTQPTTAPTKTAFFFPSTGIPGEGREGVLSNDLHDLFVVQASKHPLISLYPGLPVPLSAFRPTP